MKKALFFALVLSFLFIFVLFPCSGCKKHKQAANNDNVSESADSDIESRTTEDSVIDNPSSSKSKKESKSNKGFETNEDAESNEDLNEDVSDRVTIVDSNPDNAIVIVEGAGETLAEAKKDALRCAVEEVVGSLVDAQSRMENDELIEQILTASSAYVEKYSVLSRKIDNGLATIKIRAVVVKKSLTQKLKQSKVRQTVVIDGASLAGKATTKAESEKQGALFLANFLKNEEFPYSFIDVKINEQPEIVTKGNDINYHIKWEVSVNTERYFDFINRLIPILDKYAINKKTFELKLDSENWKNDWIMYSGNDVLDLRYDGNDIILYVCTKIKHRFQSAEFIRYILPAKFFATLFYYKRVAPTPQALITLNDGQNNVIDESKIELINLKSYPIIEKGRSMDWGRPLERISPLITMCRCKDSDVLKSYAQLIIPLAYDDYVYCSEFAFVPLLHNQVNIINDWQNFLRVKDDFGADFSLSTQELEKVKSVSISISWDSEDDSIYEKLPSIIDQIPTN